MQSEQAIAKGNDQAAFFSAPDHQGASYTTFLKQLHTARRAQSYLEVGTLYGATLKLAQCPSIAIDPKFQLKEDVTGDKPVCMLFQMTSDNFFKSYDPAALLGRPVDLAFLDGMHWYEFTLRDFINTERFCRPDSLIVLHDCIPTDSYVARRRNDDHQLAHLTSHPQWWAGDTWKTAWILKKYRPDLRILAFDAPPTGLIVVTNLDPRSTILSERYAEAVEEAKSEHEPDCTLDAYHRSLDILSSKVATAELASILFGPDAERRGR